MSMIKNYTFEKYGQINDQMWEAINGLRLAIKSHVYDMAIEIELTHDIADALFEAVVDMEGGDIEAAAYVGEFFGWTPYLQFLGI